MKITMSSVYEFKIFCDKVGLIFPDIHIVSNWNNTEYDFQVVWYGVIVTRGKIKSTSKNQAIIHIISVEISNFLKSEENFLNIIENSKRAMKL